MKTIGLCGGTGSGKGTVADIFKIFGIPSIDTDRVYRSMTEAPSPCLTALQDEFGDEIITPLGSLDRRALRSLVFDSPAADKNRVKLNLITHNFILDKTRETLKSYELDGCKAAIVDAPLLFESGFDKECDIIISVVSNKELRVLRIIRRDGISREEAERRINSQISDEELVGKSDYTIINNGDISELEMQVKNIAEQIMNTRSINK